MAYEEIGVRLRTDGAVEAANGAGLLAKGVDKVADSARAAAPQLGSVVDAVRQAATSMPVATAAATPLGAALGVVGVAAGLATIAMVKGTQELNAYQRAIILTGNAAGTTTGQLDAMAARVDAQVGTQALAAEVLAKLVSTGNVSRAQLEQGTEAAIALQRTFGIEADKTVAALSAIGRDPLQATLKLNEQYRFLTLATYDQIRALSLQGRETEAAAVAQEAFAKTGIERSKEMEKNLGLLERGWRGIKEAISEAGDAFVSFGRQNTTQQELADVEARLAAPLRRGVDPTRQQAVRESLVQRRETLRQMLAEQADAAALEAQMARVVKDRAEADAKKPDRAPRERRGRELFVGPPTFDEQFGPAANVRGVLAGRDANRAARVAELESYDETDKRERELRNKADADRRKQEAEWTQARLDEEERYRDAVYPQWRRLLDAWTDTQELMRESSERTVNATLQAGEDAWVQWATTGKLSIRSVFQAFIAEQARASFRGGLGALFSLFGGGAANAGPPANLAGDGLLPDITSGQVSQMRALSPTGGGRTVNQYITNNIDSRTDQGQILMAIDRGMQAAKSQLLEEMARGEI
jgi:phage-related minor tail protein